MQHSVFLSPAAFGGKKTAQNLCLSASSAPPVSRIRAAADLNVEVPWHYLGGQVIFEIPLGLIVWLMGSQLWPGLAMGNEWQADRTRWLAPYLQRVGNMARNRMCPTHVAGLIGPDDRKSIQPNAIAYDQLHHLSVPGR